MTAKELRETRKWMNRYRFLKKEMQAREKHLEDFIRDIYNPLQAVNIDGMPKAKGVVSDQTHSAYCRIEKTCSDILVEMQTRIEYLKKSLDEIESALDGLDEYERCVCFHKFMRGIYWADLPAYVGYEKTQCQRIEIKALEKIRKKMGNNGQR